MTTPRAPRAVAAPAPSADPSDRTHLLDLPPDPAEGQRTTAPADVIPSIPGHRAPTLKTTGGDHIWQGPLLTTVAQINVGYYAKIIIHLLGPALAILATATVINPIIVSQIVVAILAGIPVYWVTKRGYLKAVCAGLAVVAQGILAWFGPTWGLGPVSWHDWVAVLIGALSAAGVLVIPNGVKYSYHLAA